MKGKEVEGKACFSQLHLSELLPEVPLRFSEGLHPPVNTRELPWSCPQASLMETVLIEALPVILGLMKLTKLTKNHIYNAHT